MEENLEYFFEFNENDNQYEVFLGKILVSNESFVCLLLLKIKIKNTELHVEIFMKEKQKKSCGNNNEIKEDIISYILKIFDSQNNN